MNDAHALRRRGVAPQLARVIIVAVLAGVTEKLFFDSQKNNP
ncbi:hypothetical protein [Dendronalium sp. ChiSLP03b]|nr:hypothetical protein [Dendronalium sp. ChiSLP03b]